MEKIKFSMEKIKFSKIQNFVDKYGFVNIIHCLHIAKEDLGFILENGSGSGYSHNGICGYFGLPLINLTIENLNLTPHEAEVKKDSMSVDIMNFIYIFEPKDSIDSVYFYPPKGKENIEKRIKIIKDIIIDLKILNTLKKFK